MKRIVLVFATLATLLAVVPRAEAQTVISGPFSSFGSQTVIPDGDFESGLSGWGTVGSVVTFSSSTAGPLFGTTSALGTITTPFAGAGAAITHQVNGLTIGTTYVLSAFFNTANLNPLAKAYVDLSDIAGDLDPGMMGGASGMQFAYAPFVATGTSVTVRFVVDVPGATQVPAGSFATVDNIAVTPSTAFSPAVAAAVAGPEPSAIALLAVVALGVMTRRFKKR